jgi:hypothetical protein
MRILKLKVFNLGLLLTLATCLGGTLPAAESAKVIQETIPGENNRDSTFLTLGPGLAIYQGSVGWTVNVGLLKEAPEILPNLFYGLDFAINFYGSTVNPNPNISKVSASSLQLLPSAIYRFDVARSYGIFPYIGLSVGPNVYFSKNAVNNSSAALYFELLLRPGFFTTISRTVSLNVEAKLGTLGGEFIFLPQANFVFVL